MCFGVFPAARNPEIIEKAVAYSNNVHDREFKKYITENFIDTESDILNSVPAYLIGISYLHTNWIKFNYFLKKRYFNFKLIWFV